MSQIIITPEDVDFLIFDLDQKKLVHRQGKSKQLDAVHAKGQGRNTYRPFGITVDDTYIYIVSNDLLGRFNKSTYAFDSLISIPLFVNTHQILKCGDTMYTCNTSIDCIGIYDLVSKTTTQLNINLLNSVDIINVPKNANQLDGRHVNTIYDGGDKVYFCRHNKDIAESNIGYFDKNTLQVTILTSAGRCNHGIAIRNNRLYTLSTGTGELLDFDLTTLELTRTKLVDKDNTFLRGLDIVDDKLIIGCSVNFKTPGSNQMSYIMVMDPDTKQFETHELDGVRVINDLKGM